MKIAINDPDHPHGTYLMAEDFYKVAGTKTKLNYDILVAKFLYGHSVELALKSYMRCHGFSAELLRSREYGHRSDRMYGESIAYLGFQYKEKPGDAAIIAHIADPNEKYFKSGYRRLEPLSDVESLVRRILDGVRPFARNA